MILTAAEAEKFCEFNWSMQHCYSLKKKRSIADEISNQNLLHRKTKNIDVGTVETRRLFA